MGPKNNIILRPRSRGSSSPEPYVLKRPDVGYKFYSEIMEVSIKKVEDTIEFNIVNMALIPRTTVYVTAQQFADEEHGLFFPFYCSAPWDKHLCVVDFFIVESFNWMILSVLVKDTNYFYV